MPLNRKYIQLTKMYCYILSNVTNLRYSNVVGCHVILIIQELSELTEFGLISIFKKIQSPFLANKLLKRKTTETARCPKNPFQLAKHKLILKSFSSSCLLIFMFSLPETCFGAITLIISSNRRRKQHN